MMAETISLHNNQRKNWEKKGKETYVFELEEAEVAEVGDGKVCGLDGDDDLDELHRLRPH